MFSQKLEQSLKSGKVQTIGDLQQTFGEKSFAMLFLLLMFIPSLPIPTGGITHIVLLPIVMIGATEMIFGRRALWFPPKINRVKLGDKILHKGLPFMIRRIAWFEKFSRPRLNGYLHSIGLRTLTGIFVLIFAIAAFVAPPFSGLDTLPSIGAVLISLGIILEDMALYIAGILIGLIGIGVIIGAASAINVFFHHLL